MKIWLALLAVMIFGFICHGAAMDVLVEGTAVNDFQRIGASGWIVEVGQVIDGPAGLCYSEMSLCLVRVVQFITP